MDEEETIKVTPKVEYLRLWKGKDGYAWEIKIEKIDVNRLEKENKKMIEKFGEKEQ